ncbi:MAG: beta-N-acetylhexosaminidase [Burkholderiaceae bacterium]|jgi:beta-N-acetylhexosaminidase|nr:beta-N-acetylhexosaminidase [Burkholderiaceae bacterium]
MKTPYSPVMLDVSGTVLTEADQRRVCHPLTGGVILFARNYESRARLQALTRAIKALRADILIAVDHEGGRVQRFREDGFTQLPPMRQLGRVWEKDPARAGQLSVAVGYVLAAELRACGVDFSFTPVLDLDYGESAVIGDRAFHRDPQVVTWLAQSLSYGLALAGMANCGKHFPGHGFVRADSHTDIPVDERSVSAILAEDARPYLWMGVGLAAVMPAHVIYPAVDTLPAGFSARWLNLLRHELGFCGAVFSDDLSMEGARMAGGVAHAARTALSAGCDMVLVCNAPDKADQLLGELSVTDDNATRQSAGRIARLLPAFPAPDWDTLQQDTRYQCARQTVLDSVS